MSHSASYWSAVYSMMHYTLPLVVDAPGAYVTRGGDTVQVARIEHNRVYGTYSCGTPERWSARGGRVLPYSESSNDIVGKAPAGDQ